MLRRIALAVLALLPACTDRSTGDATSETTADTTSDPDPGTTQSAPSTTDELPTSTSDPTPTTTGQLCEPYTIDILIPIIKFNLVVLLDQSPAMLDPWDHDADPQTPERPRWVSVRNALLSTLSPQQNLALGLTPSPTPDAADSDDNAACPATPALLFPVSNASPAQTLADLAPADPPPGSFVGGSPIRSAIAATLEQNQFTADQPRALFVFANSAPNCNPDLAPPDLLESLDIGALAAAENALLAGLPVHVFGIGAATEPSPPIVDHRPDDIIVSDALADLATAGGGNYINVTSEQELADELAQQFETDGILTCVIDLDPPPNPDQTVSTVRVAGKPVPQVEDCANDDGWHLLENQIELCGTACDSFHDSAQLAIDITCLE